MYKLRGVCVSGCSFGGRFYSLEDTWHPDLGEPFGVMHCVQCHCEPVSFVSVSLYKNVGLTFWQTLGDASISFILCSKRVVAAKCLERSTVRTSNRTVQTPTVMIPSFCQGNAVKPALKVITRLLASTHPLLLSLFFHYNVFWSKFLRFIGNDKTSKHSRKNPHGENRKLMLLSLATTMASFRKFCLFFVWNITLSFLSFSLPLYLLFSQLHSQFLKFFSFPPGQLVSLQNSCWIQWAGQLIFHSAASNRHFL